MAGRRPAARIHRRRGSPAACAWRLGAGRLEAPDEGCNDGANELVLDGEDLRLVAVEALAQRWLPVDASISWAVILSRLPSRRTLPSTT